MFKKIDYNTVKNIVESKGGELISTEYNGINEPLVIKTSDGIIENKTLKNIQRKNILLSKEARKKEKQNNKRFTLEEVRHEITSKGGELISGEYLNIESPLQIKFPDGEIEERTFLSIKESKKLISKKQRAAIRGDNQKLSFDYVKKTIESKGGKLLSSNYKGHKTPLLIQFPDGEIEERTFNMIKRSPNLISTIQKNINVGDRRRLSYNEVKFVIEDMGGKLLSKNYIHNRKKLKLYCSCGGMITNSFFNLTNKNKEYITCIKCRKPSQIEEEIYDFIKSLYNGTIIKNDRSIITPYELDIVLPNKKLAFECNGIYWHSEQQGKDKNYHLNKTELANNQGYDLIHITDTDWFTKQPIIKDIIFKRLGYSNYNIYGRKCKVVYPTSNEIKKFLNENHLQGNIFTKYNYGLTYNDELISVMTFSKSRFNNHIDYELCRFANKLGYHVMGGFSKLLKQFLIDLNPNTIISYCDIAYFNGNVYKKNAFEWVRRSQPNYKYFTKNGYTLESRNKYQKHKLPKLLENFDPTLTEYENMTNNGYFRIWDCGNDVYVWRRHNT